MTTVHLEGVYQPSEDIVAREIEGEIIIVPLAAGIGDMEDELYSLNETGREIWKLLDGKNSLREVVNLLAEQFESAPGEIDADVLGLIAELVRRRILVEASL